MPMIEHDDTDLCCQHCEDYVGRMFFIAPGAAGEIRLCRSCLKRLEEEIKTVLEEEA